MPGLPRKIVTDVAHLRKTGNSLVLTLPKAIRDAMNWAEGDALCFRVRERTVIVESLVEHMHAAKTDNDANIVTR